MEYLSENENEIIRHILDPEEFISDSFDIVNVGMGVRLVTGLKKDDNIMQSNINPGRRYVFTAKFEKPTWDIESALGWLQENQKNFKKDFDIKKFKKTYEIKGVEIFSVGTWNGNTFTREDLDKMAETFNKTKDQVRPFLKLGHDNKQELLKQEGLPAAGWVGNMYRVDDKLLADFIDIPKKIYELIIKKAYRKVSIELFKGIEILKDKFDFMIGAIALLGAETPGVLNLNDILARYKIKHYDKLEMYSHECGLIEDRSINFKEGDNMTEKDLIDAKTEIETLKKQLEAAQAEATNFKKDVDKKDQDLEQIKKDLESAKEDYSKTLDELNTQKIEKQVQELESQNLITKAMVPFAKQLLDEKVDKYSITKDKEEKETTRFGLVKHLFELANASDVNLDDNSLETEGKKNIVDQDKLNEEIEKYALDNKVSYGDAYSAVTSKYADKIGTPE